MIFPVIARWPDIEEVITAESGRGVAARLQLHLVKKVLNGISSSCVFFHCGGRSGLHPAAHELEARKSSVGRELRFWIWILDSLHKPQRKEY